MDLNNQKEKLTLGLENDVGNDQNNITIPRTSATSLDFIPISLSDKDKHDLGKVQEPIPSLGLQNPRLSVPVSVSEQKISTKPAPNISIDGATQDLLDERVHELNQQKLKLKQYEFAIQQALFFLVKPLNSYQEWIESDSNAKLFIEIQSTKITPGIRKGSMDLNPNTIPDPNEETPEMTDLELASLENMRLCFNFLSNAQKVCKEIEDGTYELPTPQIDDEMHDLEVSSVSASLSRLPVTLAAEPVNTYRYDPKGGDLSMEQLDDFHKAPQASLPVSAVPATPAIPLPDLSNANAETLRVFATNMTTKVATLTNQVSSLNFELNSVKGRLAKEISARKSTQASKALIDAEIEGITAELFARANQMVLDETYKVEGLRCVNRDLKRRIHEVEVRAKEKQEELTAAIKKVYSLQSNASFYGPSPATPSGTKGPLTAITSVSPESSPLIMGQELDRGLTEKDRQPVVSFITFITSGFESFQSHPAIDGLIFQEFKGLLTTLANTSNWSNATSPNGAMYSTPFMRRCMIESVEPCIVNHHSTSAYRSLGIMRERRRILDMCQRGAVRCWPSNRSSQGAEEKRVSCLLCGVTRVCEYRIGDAATGKPSAIVDENNVPEEGSMRLDPLCRFCRDRVFSVQDFFQFVILLLAPHSHRQQQQLQHHNSILASFKQVLWIRRRMAMAVVGSCGLFETGLSVVDGMPGGGDWEKDLKFLY